MSKVKLFDGNELLITETQAATLERTLAAGSDGYVKINGNMIKITNISSVMKGNFYDSDTPNYTTPALAQGKKCHGEHSIQREINQIAKASGPDWTKRVQNKSWREETRKKLHASTPEWCDAKEGSCYCD